jgi:hypothetical protein
MIFENKREKTQYIVYVAQLNLYLMFAVYMYKNIDMLNQNTIQDETKRVNPLTIPTNA